MNKVAAVILAAGKGTRMKSQLPKVLHRIGGKSMVQHVVDRVKEAGVETSVVVIGHGGDDVREALQDQAFFAWQKEQLGTGHAVMQAEEALGSDCDIVFVVCGDTPLLMTETLKDVLAYHQERGALATILTADMADPTGYGRIIRRADGSVERIVEHKDATPQERQIREINTGTYCFRRQSLFAALKLLSPSNAQGEYYLTDVIEIFRKQGGKVEAYEVGDYRETLGINSRQQLAEAERILRWRTLDRLMSEGVTVIDPETTYIDADVQIGRDTVIHPFSFIQGATTIGKNCVIGPSSRLVECSIGDQCVIDHSIILQSSLKDRVTVGPFSYIRPQSELADGVKVGDFVEVKKARVGPGSKIPHLSYVGDALIGAGVNVGAGTITCNYDGQAKHRTVIGDGAFIGSNTNLVAPVEVGAGAVTGAGSTITRDVPTGALGLERSQQKNLEDWKNRRRR